MGGNYLLISDTQHPFEAKNALAFCKAVKKEFKVESENIYHVGDEVDQYFGSLYKKDPDAWYTANSELAASREKLKEWYAAFPKVKLAISNHGLRWAKKAWEAEIPSQMMRPYQELIDAPDGWIWRDEWIVKADHPFRVIHGMGYSGTAGHVNATLDAGISTAIGHVHSHAGVTPIRRSGLNLWAMNVGCLIDEESFAFHYNKYHRQRPCLGVGVVINNGRVPIWIPYP